MESKKSNRSNKSKSSKSKGSNKSISYAKAKAKVFATAEYKLAQLAEEYDFSDSDYSDDDHH
jgi:hypothetical protein